MTVQKHPVYTSGWHLREMKHWTSEAQSQPGCLLSSPRLYEAEGLTLPGDGEHIPGFHPNFTGIYIWKKRLPRAAFLDIPKKSAEGSRKHRFTHQETAISLTVLHALQCPLVFLPNIFQLSFQTNSHRVEAGHALSLPNKC